jgi:CRP-like cAMP-binding protein
MNDQQQFSSAEPAFREVVDVARLEALSHVPRLNTSLEPGQDLVCKGDPTTRCFMMVDGLACSSHTLADGRRQTTALHIAGDIPDLMSLMLEKVDSDIRAMTPCKVIWFNAPDLRRVAREDGGVAVSFWRRTLVDASIYREWITNLGRRRADERLAHFFCEVALRMNAVDRLSQSKCALQMTQLDLSEIVGLSLVHLNRTLKQLRDRELLRFDGHILEILDWEKLKRFAGFDPDYLHQDENSLGGFNSPHAQET